MTVFALKTKREKEAFLDNVNSFENLESKYKYATNEPYSFMYHNLANCKAFKNFEEEL
jgi:hypothetical protein